MASTNPKKIVLDRSSAAFDPLMRPGSEFKQIEKKAPPPVVAAPVVKNVDDDDDGETRLTFDEFIGGRQNLFGAKKAATPTSATPKDNTTALFGEPDILPVSTSPIVGPPLPVAVPVAITATTATPAAVTPTPTKVSATQPTTSNTPATSATAAAPTPTPAVAATPPTAAAAVILTPVDDHDDHNPFGDDTSSTTNDAFSKLMISSPAVAVAVSASTIAPAKSASLFSDDSVHDNLHNLDGVFIPRDATQARSDKEKAKIQALDDDLIPNDDDLDRFVKPKASAVPVVAANTTTQAQIVIDDDLLALAGKSSATGSAADFDISAYISQNKNAGSGGLFDD